jgi:hypothetical protein
MVNWENKCMYYHFEASSAEICILKALILPAVIVICNSHSFTAFFATFLSQDPHRPKHPWMIDHTENLSGTEDAYMPYSTTKPKIEAWVPPKPKS